MMRRPIAFAGRACGWMAAAVGLLLGGCAQMPREPLVQQPMTARAEAAPRQAGPILGARSGTPQSGLAAGSRASADYLDHVSPGALSGL